MKLQSIIFKKSIYTEDKARKWLVKHKYKSKKVDITENYYRFRQRIPKKTDKYYTKKITKGISIIFSVN